MAAAGTRMARTDTLTAMVTATVTVTVRMILKLGEEVVRVRRAGVMVKGVHRRASVASTTTVRLGWGWGVQGRIQHPRR